MTSEEKERKTSLPGAAVIARQPKGGQSASILGHHSLWTKTNIRCYRTQLCSHKVAFVGGNGTMIRLRKNNTEAFESNFSAVFESFLLDHFKSLNYLSLK